MRNAQLKDGNASEKSLYCVTNRLGSSFRFVLLELALFLAIKNLIRLDNL